MSVLEYEKFTMAQTLTSNDIDLMIEEDENKVDVELEVYIPFNSSGLDAEEVARKAAKELESIGYTVAVSSRVVAWNFGIGLNDGGPVFLVNGMPIAKGIVSSEELVARILALLAGVEVAVDDVELIPRSFDGDGGTLLSVVA
ncbi:MAG TPA: hypothetical protein EYH08_01435 [Pyrodictium sp.]|nr:hypothetical protein [Pyrodictium sp.]